MNPHGKRKWDATEIAYLRSHYHHQPVEQIARELGRSRHSVAYKASSLRIRKTEILPDSKECEWCGTDIARNGERAGDWKKRRFCNHACWLQSLRTVTETWLRKRTKATQDGCWEWRGDKTSNGYGVVAVDGKRIGAHRYVFNQLVEPVPSDLHVCHACDNPACVNPDHLWLGTDEDNMRDMRLKGRQAKDRRLPVGEQHHQSKLTANDVLAIRAKYADGGTSQRRLAAEYGVTQRAVANALHGRTWRHI